MSDTINPRELCNYIDTQIASAIAGISNYDYSATVITVGSGTAEVHLPTDPTGTNITVNNPNEISLEVGDQVTIHAINGNINNAFVSFRKTVGFDDIYVDYTTGTDAFGRDSSGNMYGSEDAPFKTLQYAVNRLPKNLNGRSINIYFGALDTSEEITIDGFYGGYSINIEPSIKYYTGATSINRLFVRNCTGVLINVNYLNIKRNDYWAVQVYNSYTINFAYCTISTSASSGGIFISSGSKVVVRNCTIANRTIAIRVEILSELYSMANSGSNTVYGLQADGGSTICKNGTQPMGSTSNENTTNGSVIR